MKKLNNPWAKLPGYFCFGCAPDNKAGVRMKFFSDGNDVISVWSPEQQFQGWIDTLHGGIQSVLVDEICAWVVMLNYNTTGVTSPYNKGNGKREKAQSCNRGCNNNRYKRKHVRKRGVSLFYVPARTRNGRKRTIRRRRDYNG